MYPAGTPAKPSRAAPYPESAGSDDDVTTGCAKMTKTEMTQFMSPIYTYIHN